MTRVDVFNYCCFFVFVVFVVVDNVDVVVVVVVVFVLYSKCLKTVLGCATAGYGRRVSLTESPSFVAKVSRYKE